MGNIFEFAWEPELMVWLQTHIGDFGANIASFCSWLGEETVLICLICFLYYSYDKEIGKYVGRRIMLASMFYSQIKSVAKRLRPYFVHEEIRCLRIVDADYDMYDVVGQGYSFPSGHSSNSASVYLSTAVCIKKKWVTIICILLPLLVGISRFFVGVHYPTDVLAGWAVGAGTIYLVTLLEKVLKKKWQFYLVFLLLSLPGLFFITITDYFTNLGMMVGFLVSDLFEERYVKFENTKSPIRSVLRVLGGVAVYLVMNTVLKLPFSKEFLESGSQAALYVRMVRYILDIFVTFGVYPMVFQYTAKIGKKDN